MTGAPPPPPPPVVPVPDVFTARESLAEAQRRLDATTSRLLTFDALTPDELALSVEAHAGTVGGALDVLFTELDAHDRFINRDLDRLEAARA